MPDDFQKEVTLYSYLPSKLAEELMVVSDQMGVIYSQDFAIKRPTFRNHLLLYVVQGVFHLKQYEKSFVLHAGETLLMTLCDAHEYYTDPDQTAKVMWFHFRGYSTEHLIQQLKRKNALPVIGQGDDMAGQFTRVFALRAANTTDMEYELAPLLYQMVLGMAQQALSQEAKQKSDFGRYFCELVNLQIENHIYEKITIGQLSEYTGFTKAYFVKVFPKYFNLPPHQVIQLKKLEHAATLLQTTHKSVAEISSTFGFTDQSHFGKVFKNLYGISPLHYRKFYAMEQ